MSLSKWSDKKEQLDLLIQHLEGTKQTITNKSIGYLLRQLAKVNNPVLQQQTVRMVCIVFSKPQSILTFNEYLGILLEKGKEKNKNLLDEINKTLDVLITCQKLDSHGIDILKSLLQHKTPSIRLQALAFLTKYLLYYRHDLKYVSSSK